MVASGVVHVPSVLVIDDDPVSVKVIEMNLNREGLSIITAFNGKEGREKAMECRPDLILLDINMPDETGIECCRELKKDPQISDIPVIFLSAEDDVDVKIEGFKAGGVDFITKPYNLYEVLARVKTHLKLYRAHKSVTDYQAAQLQNLSSAQKSILIKPQNLPEGNFQVFYEPLNRAGGDFYEVIRSGESVFDYFVCDVCGHSTGSALVTAGLKVLLHQNCSPLYSQSELIFELNKLIKPLLTDETYVTMVWLRVNRLSKKATLVHAGHPPAIFLSQKSAPVYVTAEGEMIGVFDKIEVAVSEVTIAPGDSFLLYSDGVLSYDNNANVEQGELLEIAKRCLVTKSEDAITCMAESVMQGNKPVDDRTFLLVKI